MAEKRTDPAWLAFWADVERGREVRDLSVGLTFDHDLGWMPPDRELTQDEESAFLRLTSDQLKSPREQILRQRHERELRDLKDKYTRLEARFWALLIVFVLLTVSLFIAWNW